LVNVVPMLSLGVYLAEVTRDSRAASFTPIVLTRRVLFALNWWSPFRIEIGDRDIQNESVMVCRRDNFEKSKVAMSELVITLKGLIDTMHNGMLDAARIITRERTKQCTSFADFISHLNQKNRCLVPFCCLGPCEENVKKRSKEESVALQTDLTFELSGAAKSLCIPFEQPDLEAGTKCFW